MLHWPDAPVRAGVVICPPLGYEAVSAYPTMRVMAESLAARGFPTMRVAFPTTGNSLRTGLADDVAEWELAIATAVEEMRSFGISRVAVVGLRFSATLAAKLAPRLAPEALVLWDPVVSGRRYTRGLRLLATEVDNGVTAAGIVFDSDTLSSMSATSFDIDALQTPTLIIQRSEPTSEPALVASTDLPITIERLGGHHEPPRHRCRTGRDSDEDRRSGVHLVGFVVLALGCRIRCVARVVRVRQPRALPAAGWSTRPCGSDHRTCSQSSRRVNRAGRPGQ